jgi:outer membrane protein OmpA-like peptidoglycan-associated protein
MTTSMMLRFPLAGLLLCACLHAQDARGSSDHPLFPNRMPGHSISSYKQMEFASHRFQTRPPVPVEGKFTRIGYYRSTGQAHPGGLAIRRNYENAFTAAGGEVLFKGTTYSVMKGLHQGNETWVEIQASDSGRYYYLTIVEKVGMKQVITADAMASAIDKDGFIALDVPFDFGKATIRPDAQPLLAEIATMLKARPALKIGVEGHTDNVGSPESNKTLSLARAKAVVSALTAAGVPAARLTPAGFGQERPIADNRLEEGRAKNRRVELVKQ